MLFRIITSIIIGFFRKFIQVRAFTAYTSKKSPMSGDIGRVWWLPQPPHHTEGVEYIEFLCKKHANETPCVSLTV